ncbi:MAG: multicopper oxidase family protein [Patescibacteria group bacterium]|jgi:FtsP/CotA-like multicopper oxidase with cupredoxin domain
MNHKIFFISLAALLFAGAGCLPAPRDGTGMMGTQQGTGSDAMREHCKMMPNMAGCEKYADQPETPLAAVDRGIVGLNDAKQQTDVTLQNGASYALDASFVKKTINGKTIRMLAYNDQIPGPILRVKQGDAVKVNFTNKLDEPTTIHWHGLRLDNANDGVPDVTQPPVNPGKSFAYNLNFPDAGLYWYHPHIREDYQQELGMYGLMWVEPSDPKTFAQVNQTAFLTLDDILLSGNDVAPFNEERINHTLMGRFGNTMLVNGSTDYNLTAKKGDIVRFAMVDTANTRVFRVGIPGAKMKLVGGDSGGYSHDQWVDSVILAPSERAIVDVQFSKSGTYKIRHLGPEIQYDLGTVTVLDASTDQDHSSAFKTLQNRSDQFADLASYDNKPIDKEIELTIDMPGMMGNMEMNGMMMDEGADEGGIEWEDSMAMMNQQSNDKALSWVIKDKATGRENDDIDYSFKQGDKVKIRILNDENSMHPMQHPIHFHGNRFVVLSVNGIKNTNPVWKDTVLVPIGAKVDILLDVTNPGAWMAHCHISEHLQDGMMFTYKVE